MHRHVETETKIDTETETDIETEMERELEVDMSDQMTSKQKATLGIRRFTMRR